MSAQDTASLVRQVYDAYNDRQFDHAAQLVTDDYEWTMVPTGQSFHGPDGMREYLAGWDRGFPESKVEITNVITSGEHAIVEFTGRGVHGGPLQTPMGEIPPTGKRAEVNFCDVYEIRGGKLRRGRSYFDMATLMRQLGLLS